MNYIKTVCSKAERQTRLNQSNRRKVVHEMEEGIGKDKHIDMVNIKSFNFIGVKLVTITKLDTSNTQNKYKNLAI